MGDVKVPKTLGFSEEKSIEKRIDDNKKIIDEVELDGAQGVNYKSSNPEKLREEIRRLEKIRQNQGATELEGRERESLATEEKRLRERLKPPMSWNTYQNSRRKDGVTYLKVLSWVQNTQNNPQYQSMVRKWKAIRRRLDPNNPHASNVMYLFD